MIRIKRKMVAILGGAAVIASGALFASPAQAAMSCQSVPGQTIGADVKVGPVVQRVPAISNIQVCVGTGSAPIVSVTTWGGTCTSNCLTVSVGGGAVDVEGLSISWREDGILRSEVVNPAPVPIPEGMCVLSVGMPDAPNPNCFIAIGPDDPTGLLTPILNTVNDAIELGLDTVEYAEAITCSVIPDRYDPSYGRYVDFCTDPVRWTTVTSDYAYDTTCGTIPDVYDPYSGRKDFCTDPIGWSLAIVNSEYESTCNTIPPAYRGYPYYSYVYFCDDPVLWTTTVLRSWCGNLCDVSTIDIQPLLDAIRRSINDNVQVQIN